jgi:hypothetical protein
MAQRQWFAACLALALVRCGGEARTNVANAGSRGRAAANSSDDAQTAPSIEAGAGGANASDATGAGSDAGESASDAEAGAPEAGTLATAGAPAVASAGAAGETDDVGAPNAVPPPSGTHLCESADDCSSALECRGRGSSILRVCVAGCAADADCATSHRCVMPSDALGPDQAACFLRCDDSPLVCPYAFDCYDISGEREYTCLPRQW